MLKKIIKSAWAGTGPGRRRGRKIPGKVRAEDARKCTKGRGRRRIPESRSFSRATAPLFPRLWRFLPPSSDISSIRELSSGRGDARRWLVGLLYSCRLPTALKAQSVGRGEEGGWGGVGGNGSPTARNTGKRKIERDGGKGGI
jgi:hypothetical protein